MEAIESESFVFTNPEVGEKKWSDYRLLIAGVSVGNVGQLAVDLLALNLDVKNVAKISSIYDNAVLPIVGKDQFDNSICSNLEVFESKESKVLLMQQRAPFTKGRIPSFRKKLMKWIEESKFKEVIMLASVSSHIRKDKDMTGSAFRFLTTSELINKDITNTHSWAEYNIKKGDDDSFHLPGAGIVKSLYEDCKDRGISFTGFLIFCNPGNNITEAMQLVQHVNAYLKLFKMVKEAYSNNLNKTLGTQAYRTNPTGFEQTYSRHLSSLLWRVSEHNILTGKVCCDYLDTKYTIG